MQLNKNTPKPYRKFCYLQEINLPCVDIRSDRFTVKQHISGGYSVSYWMFLEQLETTRHFN